MRSFALPGVAFSAQPHTVVALLGLRVLCVPFRLHLPSDRHFFCFVFFFMLSLWTKGKDCHVQYFIERL